MQVFEIVEPKVSQNKIELIIGIDFGTTNSLVAFSKNKKVRIITMENNSELLPSIITIKSKKNIIVGEKDNLTNSIRSIKRFLAKTTREIVNNEMLNNLCSLKFDQSNDLAQIIFKNDRFSLVELASKIFDRLKMQAEKKLEQKIMKAIVSVPAYFDDNQRGQIMMASKMAGLTVLRLIAEPTAAAYAYGLNKNSKGTYLVYDFGGGTFDVSILNIQTGILQVIATGGDNMMGGDDIDYLIAQYLSNKYNLDLLSDLTLYAKKAKEFLSENSTIEMMIGGKILNLTRQEIEQLITPIIDKTVNITQSVLNDVENVALQGIILVGGSSKIPLVAQKLQSYFQTKIYSDIDPEKAVVLGASLQAESLMTKQNSVLIDVVPLSLGIELYGGLTEKIIDRNTPIPCSIIKKYTTQLDYQTAIKLHIVQGEREMVKDCRSLASFELKDLPPKKAGLVTIEVNFSVDADGILSVTAQELSSGKVCNVLVHPSFSLDKNIINQELISAFENVQSDYSKKMLSEAKLKAKNLIFNLKKVLKEHSEIGEIEEREKINDLIKSLEKEINQDDQGAILQRIEILNQISKSFIGKYLNNISANLLRGQNISDLIK